jgi:hypothetical protein
MEPTAKRKEKPSGRHEALSPAALALIAGLAMAAIAWLSGWVLTDDVSADVVVVDTAQPFVKGETATGAAEARFFLLPNGIAWTDAVDPTTGAFETTVPIPLAPGTYALYVDDGLITRFVVPAGVADP